MHTWVTVTRVLSRPTGACAYHALYNLVPCSCTDYSLLSHALTRSRAAGGHRRHRRHRSCDDNGGGAGRLRLRQRPKQRPAMQGDGDGAGQLRFPQRPAMQGDGGGAGRLGLGLPQVPAMHRADRVAVAPQHAPPFGYRHTLHARAVIHESLGSLRRRSSAETAWRRGAHHQAEPILRAWATKRAA